MKGWYEVHRFTDYSIDLDLETDSDAFKFTLLNPNGIYTGLFSKFDEVTIEIDKNLNLKQLEKFKQDIKNELSKLSESVEFGRQMGIVDYKEEEYINLEFNSNNTKKTIPYKKETIKEYICILRIII